MERTEQMYTIQKHMDFGKIKVRATVVCFSAKTPLKKNTVNVAYTGFDILGKMLVMGLKMKSKEHNGTSFPRVVIIQIQCRRKHLGPVF